MTFFFDFLRKKYNNDLFRMYIITTPTIIVFDKFFIKWILDRSPFIYGPADLRIKGVEHYAPSALNISKAENWKMRRSFTEDILRNVSLNKIVDHILDNNLSLKNYDRINKFCTSIAFTILFGIGNDMLTADVLNRLILESNRQFLIADSPELETFRQTISDYIEKSQPPSLGYHIKILETSDFKINAISQVTDWLNKLRNSVSINLVNTITLITEFPEVKNKITNEIKENSPITPESIMNMKYLEATIREAMRLFSSNPIILKKTIIEDTYDRVRVDKEENIAIINSYNHRSEMNNSFPNRFNPDRWLSSNPNNLTTDPNYNYFSNGTKICPGLDLSLFIMKAYIAHLFSNFNVRNIGPSVQDALEINIVSQYDTFQAEFEYDITVPI
jgi:hypothetical protein